MDSVELRQLLSQEEDLKLDFKRQYWLRGSDSQDKQAKWNELIKDVLALTNGNTGTADQVGYLVIGAGDELRPDGTRELFDVREQGLRLDRQTVLKKVNDFCHPPIPNLYYYEIQVGMTWLAVISMPPSPFVHETTKPLAVEKRTYVEGTVFVRRTDGIFGASQAERDAMVQERQGFLEAHRRAERRSRIALALLAAVLVGVLLLLYSQLHPSPSLPMTGAFNIAVAGFTGASRSETRDFGTEVAQLVYGQLEQTFEELDMGFVVDVRGPADVGAIKGSDADKRADAAAELASAIAADIVIYGVIEPTDGSWLVTPEFYVRESRFYEAQEVVGAHALGRPLLLSKAVGVVDRINASGEADARVRALSDIAVGLSYYAAGSFAEAMTWFESAERIEGWEDAEGKEVLYLLMGNASGKATATRIQNAIGESRALTQQEVAALSADLAATLSYYERALDIDPQYARGYIGQASVHYLEALLPFAETLNSADTDFTRLELAIVGYGSALNAKHQPPLADVAQKAHLGLGQCYFAQAYAIGAGANLGPAIAEFEAVIAAYDDGANPRVRELAAEAHARLGLIYSLSQNSGRAADEYDQAASLLYDNPERQSLFKRKAQELRDAGGEN